MQIIIDDLYVHYQHTSSNNAVNPVFLRLHGRQQQWNTFDKLIELFPEHPHVVLDLPWFWKSQKPSDTWWVVEYTKLVKKFLKKVSPNEKIVVIGHSFGWRIAIELVSTTKIVEKLILLWSAGIPPKYSLFSRCVRSCSPLFNWLKCLPYLKKVITLVGRKLRSDDYLHAWTMENIFLQIITYDQQSQLSQIDIPTLLIRWDQDDQTPIQDWKKMHTLIKNSLFHVLPGTHFVYQEKPNQISAMIKTFTST